MEVIDIKKNYFEAQRSGLTEAKFKADMRFALKKIPELACFADMIDHDMGHLADGHEPMHVTRMLIDDTNVDDATEILHDDEGRYQSYYKPSAAARKTGFTGYNFIYEFTYDDDKTGFGTVTIWSLRETGTIAAVPRTARAVTGPTPSAISKS